MTASFLAFSQASIFLSSLAPIFSVNSPLTPFPLELMFLTSPPPASASQTHSHNPPLLPLRFAPAKLHSEGPSWAGGRKGMHILHSRRPGRPDLGLSVSVRSSLEAKFFLMDGLVLGHR